MTKDEILRMAREAGCVDPMVFFGAYERFATLVAAAEREACAKVVEHYRSDWDMADTIRARGQA
jgi:hypothetical protein